MYRNLPIVGILPVRCLRELDTSQTASRITSGIAPTGLFCVNIVKVIRDTVSTIWATTADYLMTVISDEKEPRRLPLFTFDRLSTIDCRYCKRLYERIALTSFV